MDFVAIEDALCAWVKDRTGVRFAVFEDRPRPMHDGRIAVLSWVADAGLGIDELRYEDSGALTGNELVATIASVGTITLQIGFESFDQRPGAPHARELARRMRARLRMPESLAALERLNIGLIGADTSTQADYRADQRMVARTVLSIRFNVSNLEREEAPQRGSIASTDVTSTISDVDGSVLPATYQMDHEDIPPP